MTKKNQLSRVFKINTIITAVLLLISIGACLYIESRIDHDDISDMAARQASGSMDYYIDEGNSFELDGKKYHPDELYCISQGQSVYNANYYAGNYVGVSMIFTLICVAAMLGCNWIMYLNLYGAEKK